MTTFQQISSNKHANRLYWNEQAKFYISMIRLSFTINPDSIYIESLQSALKSRRNFEYLEIK